MFADLTIRFHTFLGLHAWFEHGSTLVHGVGSKLSSNEIPSGLGFYLIVGIRGRFSVKVWKKDQGGLQQEGFKSGVRSGVDSDLV